MNERSTEMKSFARWKRVKDKKMTCTLVTSISTWRRRRRRSGKNLWRFSLSLSLLLHLFRCHVCTCFLCSLYFSSFFPLEHINSLSARHSEMYKWRKRTCSQWEWQLSPRSTWLSLLLRERGEKKVPWDEQRKREEQRFPGESGGEREKTKAMDGWASVKQNRQQQTPGHKKTIVRLSVK